MFTTISPHSRWSEIGLRFLVGSIVACVVLSLLDGYMKGPVYGAHIAGGDRDLVVMVSTWVLDFRYLAEQAVYAATIFFVGAKFFETRTVFTIGFDTLDAKKIKLKGPDQENIVWVGHRYGSRMEAETIAAAFAERLKESAAT